MKKRIQIKDIITLTLALILIITITVIVIIRLNNSTKITNGEVTYKHSEQDKSYRTKYFIEIKSTNKNGDVSSHKIEVSRDEYDEYSIGDTYPKD